MQSIRKKLFEDSSGSDVVGQKPNLAIIVAVIALVVSYLDVVDQAPFDLIIKIAGAGALLYWSLTELISGVNLFRKLIGVIGLLLAAYFAIF